MLFPLSPNYPRIPSPAGKPFPLLFDSADRRGETSRCCMCCAICLRPCPAHSPSPLPSQLLSRSSLPAASDSTRSVRHRPGRPPAARRTGRSTAGPRRRWWSATAGRTTCDDPPGPPGRAGRPALGPSAAAAGRRLLIRLCHRGRRLHPAPWKSLRRPRFPARGEQMAAAPGGAAVCACPLVVGTSAIHGCARGHPRGAKYAQRIDPSRMRPGSWGPTR